MTRYLKLDLIEPNSFEHGCNIVLKHKTGETRYRYVLGPDNLSWLIGALQRMQEDDRTAQYWDDEVAGRFELGSRPSAP